MKNSAHNPSNHDTNDNPYRELPLNSQPASDPQQSSQILPLSQVCGPALGGKRSAAAQPSPTATLNAKPQPVEPPAEPIPTHGATPFLPILIDAGPTPFAPPTRKLSELERITLIADVRHLMRDCTALSSTTRSLHVGAVDGTNQLGKVANIIGDLWSITAGIAGGWAFGSACRMVVQSGSKSAPAWLVLSTAVVAAIYGYCKSSRSIGRVGHMLICSVVNTDNWRDIAGALGGTALAAGAIKLALIASAPPPATIGVGVAALVIGYLSGSHLLRRYLGDFLIRNRSDAWQSSSHQSE